MDMLQRLHDVTRILPQLLQNEDGWKSLFIDYDHPIVERLWRDWQDVRIYLHCIHPCHVTEALFHPHPWPSAIRVLTGRYEMAIGYGAGEQVPPIAARLILGPGSEYEMTDPDGWHFVRPLDEPTLSLMIAGKPWSRPSPKSTQPLRELTSDQQKELLELFRAGFIQS